MRRRESDSDYPYVVAVLSDHWRVIEGSCGLQWILQRSRRNPTQTVWRGESYCRTLTGLKSAVTSLCPDAMAALDAARLPDRYIEGRRPVLTAQPLPETVQ